MIENIETLNQDESKDLLKDKIDSSDAIKSYQNKLKDFSERYDYFTKHPTTDKLRENDGFQHVPMLMFDSIHDLAREGRQIKIGDRNVSDICGIDKYIAHCNTIIEQYKIGYKILKEYKSIKEFQETWNQFSIKSDCPQDVIKEDDIVGPMTIIAYHSSPNKKHMEDAIRYWSTVDQNELQ